MNKNKKKSTKASGKRRKPYCASSLEAFKKEVNEAIDKTKVQAASVKKKIQGSPEITEHFPVANVETTSYPWNQKPLYNKWEAVPIPFFERVDLYFRINWGRLLTFLYYVSSAPPKYKYVPATDTKA